MNNSTEFIEAAKILKKLSESPGLSTLGELYGLYKQATIGDINIHQPSMIFILETQKWEAWNTYKNMDRHTAEISYITLVNELIQKYGVTE